MATTRKLPGIISLSAASMALLQSTILAKGQPLDGTPSDSDNSLSGQIISKTDKVILEPPYQKDLLRLYADHSSHASHESHSSHVSGTSDYPDYSTPSTPSAPPATYTPPPQPAPPTVIPVSTNLSTQTMLPTTTPLISTNTSSTTNSVVSKKAEADTTNIKTLTKEAAEGSSDSQFTLALYYIHGEGGCETNIEKAKMLLELAAIQGNDLARKRLEQLEAVQKSGNGK